MLGKKRALNVSRLLHLLAAVLILINGYLLGGNFWHWIAAGVFIGLLYNQQRVVKVDDLSKVNLAFFTMNGIASIVFATLVIISLYQ